MNRNSRSAPPHELLAEINEQVHCLQELSRFYCSPAGTELLERIPSASRYLFVADEPEVPVSQLAAQFCCSQGVDASAVHADALTQWPATLLDRYDNIFVFSSDKANLADRHMKPEQLVSITGNPENELGGWAGTILPTFTGLEKWSGSKSFLSSVVLSWLISRRLAQKQDGSEADQLKRLRQRIQLLLEGNSAVLEQWQHCLEGSETLALSGPGLQAQIADRASLCLFEWAGIQASVIPWPASSYPHAAGWTVIELCSSLLSGAGEASEQTQSSQTIRLLDGYPQRANDPLRPTAGLPVELENLLNWVSLQLLASSINCK